MPLTHANADADRLAEPATTVERLRSALSEARPDAPIAVLIHGFQYSLQSPEQSPHHTLFSPHTPGSWPQRLGQENAPVCIGFGWESLGTIWQAYARARRAGHALAELVDLAATLAPSRRITLVAHSLGVRVALQSLRHLPPHALSRAILMAGAEYRFAALEAADCPAGREADFLNVTSAQNRPYDLMLEYALQPGRRGRSSMARGMAVKSPRWTDLRLSCPSTRTALSKLGYPLAPPTRRICHGSTYSAPGIFSLYRAALSDASLLARLHAALPAPDEASNWRENLARLATFSLPQGNRRPS